jgi:hypothetical protein
MKNRGDHFAFSCCWQVLMKFCTWKVMELSLEMSYTLAEMQDDDEDLRMSLIFLVSLVHFSEFSTEDDRSSIRESELDHGERTGSVENGRLFSS